MLRYQISAQASSAAATALEKAKQLNEEHKITDRAAAAAGSVFTSLSGAMARMTTSSTTTSSAASSSSTAEPGKKWEGMKRNDYFLFFSFFAWNLIEWREERDFNFLLCICE